MLKIRIVVFLLLALAFPLKTVQAEMSDFDYFMLFGAGEGLDAERDQKIIAKEYYKEVADWSGYNDTSKQFENALKGVDLEAKNKIDVLESAHSKDLDEKRRNGEISAEEYWQRNQKYKDLALEAMSGLDEDVKNLYLQKMELRDAQMKKFDEVEQMVKKNAEKEKENVSKRKEDGRKKQEQNEERPKDEGQSADNGQQAEEEGRKKADKEKSDAYLKQIMSVEEDEEEPDPLFSSGGNADGSGSKSGLGGICGDAGNVFSQIACKATQLLIDLRVIAYVISGFGMIAFAYAAIFNKISWKHFSQIGIGLFILSMTGPLVEYISGDDRLRVNLEYGNYLGGRYKGIEGASDDIECGHGVNANNCLPDVEVTAPKKKWSIKDLKGSIQAGIDVARGAYKTYQGAKASVQTVKQNAAAIKNAIKNSGGGLDGVLSAATQVAGATNNIMFAGKTGMNALAMGATDIANAAQDVTATNAERKKNQNIRLNGENGKTTNKVAAWLAAEGAGGKMVNDASRVANTVSKGASSVGVAANAGYEGKKMGGGGALGAILGGAMAAGTAVGEGVGLYTDEKMAAAIRKEEKAQQAEAKQLAAKKEAQQAAEKKAAEKAEMMKQSQEILDNFAKQQGSAAGGEKKPAASSGNKNASASQAAASGSVASPQTAPVQAKDAGPVAESVRTAQPVRPASEVIAENKKSGASANEGISSSSAKQGGGAAPVATGSAAPKLTNKNGSTSSLNSDGSITVVYKDGSTATHAADSDYAKSIAAYMRDNPEAAKKIFMDTEKNGGEAYNGLNQWKKAQGF